MYNINPVLISEKWIKKEKMIEDSIIAKTFSLSATTHTQQTSHEAYKMHIYTYIHNFTNTEKIHHA